MNILVAIASSIIFIVSTFACDNSDYPIGSGFITSPNYPSNYDNNAQCSYFLQADQLNTTPAGPSDNSTWPSDNSTWPFDNTTWPGDNSTWPTGSFDNTTWPSQDNSTWPFDNTTWPSDDNSTWPYDNYTTVIGGGGIGVVQLIFSDFATEECCDRLYILDGPSINSPLIRRLSGNYDNNMKLAFESTQPYMKLNFITDQTVTSRGFRATYQSKALYRNDCPNSSGYPVGSGVLISPNYPNAYTDNQDCTYLIDAGDIGRRLQLDFDVFDLEPNYDFVSVFDGDSQVSQLIANLTGYQQSTVTFQSTGQYMTIKFRSDASINRNGFHVQYSLI